MKNIAKGVTPDGRIVEGFLFWMEIDGEVKPCISRSPLKVNDWGEVKYDGDVVLEDTIRYSTGLTDVNDRTLYYGDIVMVERFDGTQSFGTVHKKYVGNITIFAKDMGFVSPCDVIVTVMESSERLGYTAKKTKWDSPMWSTTHTRLTNMR